MSIYFRGLYFIYYSVFYIQCYSVESNNYIPVIVVYNITKHNNTVVVKNQTNCDNWCSEIAVKKNEEQKNTTPEQLKKSNRKNGISRGKLDSSNTNKKHVNINTFSMIQ